MFAFVLSFIKFSLSPKLFLLRIVDAILREILTLMLCVILQKNAIEWYASFTHFLLNRWIPSASGCGDKRFFFYIYHSKYVGDYALI